MPECLFAFQFVSLFGSLSFSLPCLPACFICMLAFIYQFHARLAGKVKIMAVLLVRPCSDDTEPVVNLKITYKIEVSI